MIGPPVIAAGLGPLGHDPGEVRSRAEDLLSRAPFTDHRPGPVRRLLRTLGDLVASFLGDVLDGVFATGLLPWVLVVLGIGVVSWLVWRITRGLAVDRSIAEVPAASVTRDAAAWHADADAAEARGDRREALRLRYAAMVASLLAEGTLEDVPGRTVHELDLEVARASPGIADQVAAAGERFDDAIYGRYEVTDDDLEVVALAARAAAGRSERPTVARRA
jgi:hypothetical protein